MAIESSQNNKIEIEDIFLGGFRKFICHFKVVDEGFCGEKPTPIQFSALSADAETHSKHEKFEDL